MSVKICRQGNNITGSWFPTGYHGHFRNHVRLDFMNEYRLQAKPKPPEKFLRRSRANSAKHVFSVHDNRHALVSDALYFEQGEGLGRRRVKSRSSGNNAELLVWQPHKTDLEKCGPLNSVYTSTFRNTGDVDGSPQKLVFRPKSSFDRGTNSMYRYAHCGQNQVVSQSITSLTPEMTGPRQTRPKTANPNASQTVATCMSWHAPRPPPFKLYDSRPTNTVPTVPTMEPALPTAPETTSAE